MPEFLTVKEAAKLTGKSASSIRRVIYPIVENDQHPDRHHVQPGIEEVHQLRMKGEIFGWRLSEELLRREVPVTNPSTNPDEIHRESDARRSDGLLDMLRRELDIKNGQITQQSELIGKQMEVINGLSERLRESNHIIGSQQQQLTLNERTGRAKQSVVETSSSETKEKDSTPQKPNRKWFTWSRS